VRYLVVMPVVISALFLSFSLSLSVVHGQQKLDNPYFSLRIPDSWTYAEYSNTYTASVYGRGPVNLVDSAPAEFGDILVQNKDDDRTMNEKIQDGGVYSEISQDTDYSVKNAPVETYAKYKSNNNGDVWNATSQENSIVGKEKAIKVYGNGTGNNANLRFVEYFVLHDKEPYQLEYGANMKDYAKYLPDFDQTVKSFRFK
jgi:hypothetical protein